MASISIIDKQLMDMFARFECGKIGSIHSIFDRAVNILSNDEKHLISLATETVVQSPKMMKTNDCQSFSRLNESARVGGAVIWENDSMIRIGSSHWNFGEAKVWDEKISRFPLILREEFTKEIAKFLSRNGHERNSGLFSALLAFSGGTQLLKNGDNIYKRAFLDGLRALDGAIKNDNRKDILQASNRLLGLGFGLTPSGDDFLLGCLTVWQVFDVSLFLYYQDENWLKYVKEHTTIVSYFMLEQCLSGFANHGFIELFRSFHMGRGLARALDIFLEIGSTSGIDMLCGAIFAMQYIEGDEAENHGLH